MYYYWRDKHDHVRVRLCMPSIEIGEHNTCMLNARHQRSVRRYCLVVYGNADAAARPPNRPAPCAAIWTPAIGSAPQCKPIATDIVQLQITMPWASRFTSESHKYHLHAQTPHINQRIRTSTSLRTQFNHTGCGCSCTATNLASPTLSGFVQITRYSRSVRCR